MPEDNRPAVLFDVDGTLVDTNWFHTVAWWRAFRDSGEDIPMARIHPLIGMGSAEMLQELFGDERSDLKDGHTKYFDQFLPEIRAFAGAGDLLRAVKKRAHVVMATSSKESHLKPMLEAIDANDAIDGIVHGDDVERAKPAPDVFEAALEKAGRPAERCVVIGDTRWDVEAAAKRGLRTVCVLTGGNSRETLESAGAIAVYEDVRQLLDHLDDSPVGRLLAGDS